MVQAESTSSSSSKMKYVYNPMLCARLEVEEKKINAVIPARDRRPFQIAVELSLLTYQKPKAAKCGSPADLRLPRTF